MAISKIKKNSLTTGIIDEELVTADVINEQTELSGGAASNDTILVYDTSASVLKKVTQTNFLNFPTVSSVSPTNVLSGDGTGNHTFVITGSGFTGATASLVNASGSTVSFASQTVDSDTQITGVIAKSSLPGSGEPYDVKVTAASGLASTLENQINVDQSPVFSTAAGSLGTVANGARSGLSFTVAAADPESGGDPVYTLESGSIPAGLSFASTSSGAVISGTADAVGSNTTSTFTIRAKDAASNTSDREFSITVSAPTYQSFTSSGTFSVPSGVSSVDVLVVAGGGAAGPEHGGGGGAGGLIYRPGFTVTPGGTITVTVGDGGVSSASTGPADNPQPGWTGQDSVFGTLTAKGGGSGGNYHPGNSPGTVQGDPGGSAGGGAAPGSGPVPSGGPGTALQPTQPGESGNYGFGNVGGAIAAVNAPYSSAGGGGAGGVGADGGASARAGNGGIGKAYTIADGTTSVYYAGGGGGGNYGPEGNYPGTASQGGVGGQGGGGDGNSLANDQSGPGQSGQNGTANRGGGAGSPTRWQETQPGSGHTQAGGTIGGKGIVIVTY